MALVGYARGSTDEQDTAAKHDALRAQGCPLILEYKASGGSRDMPNHERALERAVQGTTKYSSTTRLCASRIALLN